MTEAERKLMDYYLSVVERFEISHSLDSKGDKIITLKNRNSEETIFFNDDKDGKLQLLKYIKDNS